MAGYFEGKGEEASQTPEQLIEDVSLADLQRKIGGLADTYSMPTGEPWHWDDALPDDIKASVMGQYDMDNNDPQPHAIVTDSEPLNSSILKQSTDLDKSNHEPDVRKDFHESLLPMEEGGFRSRHWPWHESGTSVDFGLSARAWLYEHSKQFRTDFNIPIDVATWHIPEVRVSVSEENTSSLDLDK